jgi:hypothetical protein
MTYHLEPYGPKSRHTCPSCRHRSKSFTRYINSQTSQYLADHVGRCSRENKCGYHFTPGKYFSETGQARPASKRLSPFGVPYTAIAHKRQAKRPLVPAKPQAAVAGNEPHYINPNVVNDSFLLYDSNNLVQYLINTFGFDAADKAVGRYRIGTSGHWPGATVFWQLDTEGFVRTGKVMLYNAKTGKRVKQPFNHVTWAHVLILRDMEFAVGGSSVGSGQLAVSSKEQAFANCKLLTANFHLEQVLFGAHLLAENPNSHVAIVESEKTAIIASMHDDKRIWLATGSLGNLNPSICQALKGRTVTLYPDLGAYPKWKAKARTLQRALPGSAFTVSDLLERMASDEARNEGLDLGDGL